MVPLVGVSCNILSLPDFRRLPLIATPKSVFDLHAKAARNGHHFMAKLATREFGTQALQKQNQQLFDLHTEAVASSRHFVAQFDTGSVPESCSFALQQSAAL